MSPGRDRAESFSLIPRTRVSSARLTRADLEAGLRDVVTRLHSLGDAAEIRVVGGAAIALWHNAARGATHDLDAALSPGDVVLDVARDVAEVHRWANDWLNDAARIFLPNNMGRGEEWETVYSRDGVVVKVASLDMLIAMKLHAAQRRGRREYDDLRALLAERGITTVDEAESLFEGFYPGDALNETASRVLAVALENPMKAEIKPPVLE